MLEPQSRHSRLSKVSITCKTCDVSESFYSDMSVERFRLEHAGHELLEGGVESTGKVRLLKVLVELVMLPAYSTPVFTITGVKEDLKNAFVQVVSPSQRDQVKETLEKGKYLDSGAGDTVYVWEPKAITISEGATLAMSIGRSSPADSSPTEPNAASEEPTRSEPLSNSGDIQEIEVAPSGGEQSAMTITEAAPQTQAPALLALPAPSDSATPSPPSNPSPSNRVPRQSRRKRTQFRQPSLSPEPNSPTKPSPESKEVSMPATSPEKEVVTISSDEGSERAKTEEDNYLLVSRSWYVEKGAKNMREAVRISRLLRPFRWRIEPAYTIGVMVDDILSVETANGEIGGDMTREIESAGYEFSRVSIENGKPVAWFKKEQSS